MTHHSMSGTETDTLQFFGRVNASISHELKNILAIISETTGFLDDLVQLARQGKQFDLAILEKSNKSIAEEIERGFHTIRQMNKFAHSVDDTDASTDVAACTELASNLSAFLSSAKPVRIVEPAGEIRVQTVPVLLINALYQVICTLCREQNVTGITVGFEAVADGGAAVVFSGPGLGSPFPGEIIPEGMKSRLGIELETSGDSNELKMRIPAGIGR